MRHIVILLAVLLAFSCKSNSNNESENTKTNYIEFQAIQALFNTVKSDELKNDRFGIIIECGSGCLVPIETRPAYLVTWFKYNLDDKYIMANYRIFPHQEDFSDPFDNSKQNQEYSNGLRYDRRYEQFDPFLKEIIDNKGIVNIKNVKQLTILTPKELQNDELLNKMFREKKIYQPILDGWSCYWGFKTSKKELITDTMYYSDEFLIPVQYMITSITEEIYFHETPLQWKMDYLKYFFKEYDKEPSSPNYYTNRLLKGLQENNEYIKKYITKTKSQVPENKRQEFDKLVEEGFRILSNYENALLSRKMREGQ